MRIVVLISLITFCSVGYGQTTFCPEGATWYYDYVNFSLRGYEKVEYIGDTLLAGKNAKVLESEITIVDLMYQPYSTGSQAKNYEYIYSSNDTVYRYYNGSYKMLYDFGASVGDTWVVDEQHDFGMEDSTGTISVDSISQEIINNQTLQVLYTATEDTSFWGYYGKVTERMGCLFYLFPLPSNGVVDAYGQSGLRCYYDDEFGWYHHDTTQACDYVINDITTTQNPFIDSTKISVHLVKGDTVSLNVYDVLGQNVANFYDSTLICRSDTTVLFDASLLDNGVYFASAIINGEQHSLKLIKSATLRLAEVTANSIKLYPNPTSDDITIEFNNSQARTLNVFSIRGELMRSESISSSKSSISLADYTKGLYLIEIIEGDNVYRDKIIVE
jgi:hypothetical protein